ncbi:MAG: hypothetical protein KME54_26555 [Tolypothrix brevis GSE-NOS-MK-07-07A]|nr:hypothetical protein [Tolypothrix brevis GSE-NOS-MK-07-07A]
MIDQTVHLQSKNGNYSSKPPGDPHQNCIQFGGGRNGGLIAKRPLSKFVRLHKQRGGQLNN